MIDYNRIGRSIDYYESKGFSRIESPWTVTKSISKITKPQDKIDWTIKEKDKVLVASGEQSFLYLYLKGFLPKGRYQTVTPCFREEIFDETHTKYFMKNEIMITDKANDYELEKVIDFCKLFFESELGEELDIVKTGEGYDLEIDGIELGSYGIRNCDYLEWIYATGLAEPRFSFIKNRINV